MRGGCFRTGGVDQPVQRGQHPHHCHATHAKRRREARAQQRALAQDDLVEGARATGIAYLRRIAAQKIQREGGARHVLVHQVVDRAGCLVVGFAGIEDETVVISTGQREPDMQRAGAMAIAVDRIGETMGANRERFAELAAHQSLRAAQQLAQRVLEHAGGETLDHLLHPTHAEIDTRHQRARIAAAGRRIAGVAIENFQGGGVGDTAVDQFRWRDDDAFLEDVSGVGRDRTGTQAANIGEVRPPHDEGATASGVEDRSQEHLIVRVRDRAAAAVTVVIPIQIARLNGLNRKMLEHRAADIAEDRHVGADRHHAIGVEERRVEVFLFANERGNGGAFEQCLHLRLRRAHGTANDFQRDGIAWCHSGSPERRGSVFHQTPPAK